VNQNYTTVKIITSSFTTSCENRADNIESRNSTPKGMAFRIACTRNADSYDLGFCYSWSYSPWLF